MSFDNLIKQHDQKKVAEEAARANAAKIAAKESDEFAAKFVSQVSMNVVPLFGELVAALKNNGYHARMDSLPIGADGYGNPYIRLHFVPEQGTQLDLNASNESVFVIKGVIAQKKIEFASYFDQRPETGQKGIKTFFLPNLTIEQSVLRHELEEFVQSALNARA